MLRLVLLVILVLALLGSVPMWGYSAGWGYGPSGGPWPHPHYSAGSGTGGDVSDGEHKMARKYSKAASKERQKRRWTHAKKGTLRSGPGGKGGKVTSRKQAIAIGLSEARAEGKKVRAEKENR